MRKLFASALCLMIIGLTACNLGGGPTEAPEPLPTDDVAETQVPDMLKPVVTIISPRTGDQIQVDQQVLVSVNAIDSVGVTRVQLFANGTIVKTVSSESLAGNRDFPAVLDYTPRATGSVTMQVLAFRGSVASDPAEITLTVIGSNVAVPTSNIANPPQFVPSIPNDGVCRALTNSNLNLRREPTTAQNNVITVLSAATLAPIIARLPDNSWWKINANGQVGWVSAQFTSVSGNCLNVPIETLSTATPTVTSTPAITATPTRTATPSITPTPQRPDLVVTSIVGETDVVIPSGATGITLEYAATITNTGLGPAGSFSVLLEVIRGTNITEIDMGVVSGLTPAQSVVLTTEITFETAGAYTLRITADNANMVQEVSEVNNVGTLAVTVTGP